MDADGEAWWEWYGQNITDTFHMAEQSAVASIVKATLLACVRVSS